MSTSPAAALLIAWMAGSPALAQQHPPPPPPPQAQAPLSAPLSAPVVGDMMSFRDRALVIREQAIRYPGSTTVVHSNYGYGWGWPYWGYGGSYVITSPDTIEYSWAVFQGQARITVPAYLDLVGQDALRDDLTRRISRSRAGSTVMFAVSGVGAIAGLAGLYGVINADSFEEYRSWGATANVGVATMFLGAAVGFSLQGSARKLRMDFPATLDPVQVQDWNRQHNKALARELGITPAQAAEATRPR